ncbi:MAG TPA: hypothetical protein VFI25_07220 [Planctomycetota bacterium]|nr:hypothetical protein [Planctomycetota bacterium]
MALIGADGAGKTTVGRRLEGAGDLPIKYLYMGINADASNHALLTTRAVHALRRLLGRRRAQGGPPDPSRARERPRGVLRRSVRGLKSGLVRLNRLGEEWFRQALAWYWQRRGFVVLFDRHFYADYWAHDVAPNGRRSPGARLHGWLLRRLYPRPDLVVLLDAPAQVLFARKAEGSVELLERRRLEYLALAREWENLVVVDAGRPTGAVAGEVLEIIRRASRRAGRGR